MLFRIAYILLSVTLGSSIVQAGMIKKDVMTTVIPEDQQEKSFLPVRSIFKQSGSDELVVFASVVTSEDYKRNEEWFVNRISSGSEPSRLERIDDRLITAMAMRVVQNSRDGFVSRSVNEDIVRETQEFANVFLHQCCPITVLRRLQKDQSSSGAADEKPGLLGFDDIHDVQLSSADVRFLPSKSGDFLLLEKHLHRENGVENCHVTAIPGHKVNDYLEESTFDENDTLDKYSKYPWAMASLSNGGFKFASENEWEKLSGTEIEKIRINKDIIFLHELPDGAVLSISSDMMTKIYPHQECKLDSPSNKGVVFLSKPQVMVNLPDGKVAVLHGKIGADAGAYEIRQLAKQKRDQLIREQENEIGIYRVTEHGELVFVEKIETKGKPTALASFKDGKLAIGYTENDVEIRALDGDGKWVFEEREVGEVDGGAVTTITIADDDKTVWAGSVKGSVVMYMYTRDQ